MTRRKTRRTVSAPIMDDTQLGLFETKASKSILLATLGGSALLLWVLSRMNADAGGGNDVETQTLADYLRLTMPDVGRAWADDIASGISGTVPSDYADPSAPTDSGAALRRWALGLAAVGFHESAFGTSSSYYPKGSPTGYGDGGNAFGFFQLDKRYHAKFIATAAAQTVAGQVKYAAGILAGNWRSFKGQSFYDREQLMFTTYNASLSRIKGLIASGTTVFDADQTSTLRNGEGYGQNIENYLTDWSA